MEIVTENLALRINEHHRQAFGNAAKAVEHPRQAGELLLRAKASLSHGEWLPWLRDHCDVGEREAQRYMRLARQWSELKFDTVSDLSLRGALELTSRFLDPLDAADAATALVEAAIEVLVNAYGMDAAATYFEDVAAQIEHTSVAS